MEKDNKNKHNLGLATVLSFFFPGVGQMYKGQVLRGIFYFLLISGLYATIVLIPLALLFHLMVIIGASQELDS